MNSSACRHSAKAAGRAGLRAAILLFFLASTGRANHKLLGAPPNALVLKESPLGERSPGAELEPPVVAPVVRLGGEATKPPSRVAHGLGFTPVAGVTFSRETSAMIGAAGILFYKPPPELTRRTSTLQTALAYSIKQQFAAQTDADWFLFSDALWLNATLNFLFFPDSFFGVGNDTRLDDAEDFTPRVWELNISPQFRTLKDLYVGPWLRVEDTVIVKVEPGGVLDSGGVVGADGGREVALGIGAAYDTRDNSLYPTRGVFVQFFTQVTDPLFGADFRTSRTKLDARRYFPMPWPYHVLAVQVSGRFMSGVPPFFALSRLGGDKLLRGHFLGRYRDKQYIAGQVEYRLPLVWRLGGAAFAGTGDVAPHLSEYRLKDLKYSLGGGLRLNVSSKDRVNVRADLGWGGDEYNFYVQVGEAF